MEGVQAPNPPRCREFIVLAREAQVLEIFSVPASVSIPASKRHKEAGPIPLGMRKELVVALGSSSWHHLSSSWARSSDS